MLANRPSSSRSRLPDLVAVQLLFVEQAQDGQVEHVSPPRPRAERPSPGAPRLAWRSRAACVKRYIRSIYRCNHIGRGTDDRSLGVPVAPDVRWRAVRGAGLRCRSTDYPEAVSFRPERSRACRRPRPGDGSSICSPAMRSSASSGRAGCPVWTCATPTPSCSGPPATWDAHRARRARSARRRTWST